MKFFSFIKTKKITAEASTLRLLMQQKAEKLQAMAPRPTCNDLVHMQISTHTEACFDITEVQSGKRLAATFEGLTAVELFKPLYPNERRNRAKRNKLSQAEEEVLHQTRIEIRTI